MSLPVHHRPKKLDRQGKSAFGVRVKGGRRKGEARVWCRGGPDFSFTLRTRSIKPPKEIHFKQRLRTPFPRSLFAYSERKTSFIKLSKRRVSQTRTLHTHAGKRAGVHLFLQPRPCNQAAVAELSATFLAAPSLYLSQPVFFVKSSAG